MAIARAAAGFTARYHWFRLWSHQPPHESGSTDTHSTQITCLWAPAGAAERVVGCAGLLMGSEVSYFDGGESMADPDRPCVAAVRRLVVDCQRVPEVSECMRETSNRSPPPY